MTSEPSAFETRVAELVAAAVAEIVHVDMRDRPDADLTHVDGRHVGLEIVCTVDQIVAFGEKRMIEARDQVELALQAANVTGRFLISFDLLAIGDGNGRSFRKWLNATTKALVNLLGSPSATKIEQPTLEASGISRIAYIECKAQETLSVGRGSIQHFTPGQSVAEQRLRGKDELLTDYVEINGEHFAEYWLAIASVGAGTVEDGGYSLLMDRNFTTSYDRVFLIFRATSSTPPYAKEITPNRLPT